MNKKRKSENELIDSIFKNERTKAEQLLDKCKKREKSTRFIIVRLGKTIYLVPEGTDIEKWSINKIRNLEKFRKN